MNNWNVLINKGGRWVEGNFKDLKPGQTFRQTCQDGRTVTARCASKVYRDNNNNRTVMAEAIKYD